MARIVELIETQRVAGTGTGGDPIRTVEQLFTKDGVLVAECDRWAGSQNCWYIPPQKST